MKGVIINAVCAFVMMLVQSNFHSAFGVTVMAHFTIIAVILSCALAMPPAASGISILILGIICDLMVSGPAGLYPLLLSIIYVGVYLVMTKLRSERVMSMMIYAAVSCILFELLLCIAYCVIYQSWQYWSIFIHGFIWNALLTTCFTPIMMYLNRSLEKLFDRKKTSNIS